MVEGLVVTGSDDGQVVSTFLQVRVRIGNFESRFTAPGERLRRTENGRIAFRELKLPTSDHAAGKGLAVQLVEQRLGIERIDLAWAPLHEQKNDVLRFGGKMRRFGFQRVFGRRCSS